MEQSASEKAAADYAILSEKVQAVNARRLFSAHEFKPGQRVLDIGCGTGNLARVIAGKVGETGSVLGIDPEAERIRVAKEKSTDFKNVEFVSCYSVEFPMKCEEEFDFACSTSVFHWIPDEGKQETFHRLYKALKYGGQFYLAATLGYDVVFQSAVDALPDYKQKIKDRMHFSQPEDYEKMASAAGFTVKLSKATPFPFPPMSASKYLHFLEATGYGEYPFTSINPELLNLGPDGGNGIVASVSSEYDMLVVKEPKK